MTNKQKEQIMWIPRIMSIIAIVIAVITLILKN